MGYPRLTDLAFLSDTHTAALVGPDGAVEWFCAPQFDGPSVCARLLDRERGGSLTVGVEGGVVTRREYVRDTLVLETHLDGPDGSAVLTDVLAVAPSGADRDEPVPGHVLVRLLRCTSGRVRAVADLDLRPDYARARPVWTERDGRLHLDGTDVAACGTFPLERRSGDDGDRLHGVQELAAGEAVVLALGYGGAVEVDVDSAGRLVEDSLAVWDAWNSRCTYDGYAAAAVRRSAAVLRGLAFDESGALVAAPTTSLPEWIGGERNWDYRYTWHRDASLHVLALFRLGHAREGAAYLDFLLSPTVVGGDVLSPMATIDGGADLTERTLDHLEGYCGSRPVRIGNEAYEQVQWDTYGHVLDAAYAFHGLTGDLGEQRWVVLRRLVEDACARWREPDSGLWEVRSGARRHTYSVLMLWVCLDRGIRLAEDLGLGADCLDRWRTERDAIREDLLENGFDDEVGAFVQAYGDTAVDASLLRVPLVGFLPADDPRVLSTLDVVLDRLGDGPALVHRYDTDETDDGLEGPEGAFLLCSFDAVSVLVLAGRVDEARERFEWILERSGPFGLLPEEMTADGQVLGNYPQAFSHLSLIEAALNLDERGTSDALHGQGRRRA